MISSGARRTISKHMHFVEIKADGSAGSGGYAPYLDYRAPGAEETTEIRKWLKDQTWLTNNVENIAKRYAVQNLIPPHIAEVKTRKNRLLDKTDKAVRERLTAEIQYWDFKSGELAEKEAAGKKNAKLNSKLAARRAEDLQMRMQARLEEIQRERQISPMPPVVTGGALVIPKGLLHKLMYTDDPGLFGQGDRTGIEYAAMNAVFEIETRLGYRPTDVSAAKCGYDVESFIPEEMRNRADAYSLRLIEVKGRAKGASTVTVSKNEILTALNKPEEYILAIVEIDNDNTHATYLKQPFTNTPDFTANSVNYDIAELIREAEIIYQN